MPNDPDPRKKIHHDFFQSCLYAYFENGHLLSDDDAITIMLILDAYAQRHRVSRNTYYKAKDILRDLHNRS